MPHTSISWGGQLQFMPWQPAWSPEETISMLCLEWLPSNALV